MSGLTVMWTPEDVAAVAALLAEHEAVPAAPAELAPVIDITTREVIA